MARVLFGIMGDAQGHVNRAMALAGRLSGHEFLFVGGGRVLGLRPDRRVLEVPVPGTFYARNRVNLKATALNGFRVLRSYRNTLRNLLPAVKAFDPDLVLSDFELFSQGTARALGAPCVSVSPQHAVTRCRPAFRRRRTFSRLLLVLSLRMYSRADRYLIPSLGPTAPVDPETTEVFPPVLSPAVSTLAPRDDGHILVYQTSPTFERILPVLEALGRRILVYGFGHRSGTRNIRFKGPSKNAFLRDLASCRYAVTNGGLNAISEALFLGKPVLSFPIRGAYEQLANAQMLRHLEYGDCSLDPAPGVDRFLRFEKRIGRFRSRLSGRVFDGTDRMARRLEEIIERSASAGRSRPRGRTP
jgi:uncharacterized protein (TIGR00661 family)